MANIHDVSFVRGLFVDWYDTYEGADNLYEIRYARKGEDVGIECAEGWDFKVVDTDPAQIKYDSYGNGYTEDGFVVFSVSDGENTALYKLPVNYASYEGYTIEPDKITEVTSKPRTIMEWVEV